MWCESSIVFCFFFASVKSENGDHQLPETTHSFSLFEGLMIARLLLEEKSKRTFESVEFRFTSFFVGIVKQHRASIAKKPGSGWPSRITQEIKQIGEAQMQEDDKTLAMQLHALLKSKGINISRCRIIVVDLRLAGSSVAALTGK